MVTHGRCTNRKHMLGNWTYCWWPQKAIGTQQPPLWLHHCGALRNQKRTWLHIYLCPPQKKPNNWKTFLVPSTLCNQLLSQITKQGTLSYGSNTNILKCALSTLLISVFSINNFSEFANFETENLASFIVSPGARRIKCWSSLKPCDLR